MYLLKHLISLPDTSTHLRLLCYRLRLHLDLLLKRDALLCADRLLYDWIHDFTNLLSNSILYIRRWLMLILLAKLPLNAQLLLKIRRSPRTC
jgi:hypothetical protein